MWLEGKEGASLGLDDMRDRPIRGTTDWEKYEIILKVPPESASLHFGITLSGGGKIWINQVKFEVVNDDVPTTESIISKKYLTPTNLDFSE